MKIYFIFFILSCLTSCAYNVDYNSQIHRFASPETEGTDLLKKEIKGFVGGSFGLAHEVTLAEAKDSFFFGQTLITTQRQNGTENLGANAGLGILPYLDAQLRLAIDSPPMFIVKTQLVGSSFQKNEKGFKLGSWAGYGSMNSNEGKLVSISSREYQGHVSLSNYEIGLSFGQRFTDYLLGYTNLVHSYSEVRSTLEASNFSTVYINGFNNQDALAIGLKVHQAKTFLNVELARSRNVFKGPNGRNSHYLSSVGLNLGYQF